MLDIGDMMEDKTESCHSWDELSSGGNGLEEIITQVG